MGSNPDIQTHRQHLERELQRERRAIERAQAGDPAALEPVLAHHAEGLFAALLGRVGERAEAEALLEATFVAALERITVFVWPAQGGIYPWLRQIALQILAEHHKPVGRRVAGQAPQAGLDEPGAALSAPEEEHLLRRRTERALRAARGRRPWLQVRLCVQAETEGLGDVRCWGLARAARAATTSPRGRHTAPMALLVRRPMLWRLAYALGPSFWGAALGLLVLTLGAVWAERRLARGGKEGLVLLPGTASLLEASLARDESPSARLDLLIADRVSALDAAREWQRRADRHLQDGDRAAAEADVAEALRVQFPQGAPEAEVVRLDARARLARLYLAEGGAAAEGWALQEIEAARREVTRDSLFGAYLEKVAAEVYEARGRRLGADPEGGRLARQQALEARQRGSAIERRVKRGP